MAGKYFELLGLKEKRTVPLYKVADALAKTKIRPTKKGK